MKKLLLPLLVLSSFAHAHNDPMGEQILKEQAHKIRALEARVRQLEKKIDNQAETIVSRCTGLRRGLIDVKYKGKLYIIECEKNPGI